MIISHLGIGGILNQNKGLCPRITRQFHLHLETTWEKQTNKKKLAFSLIEFLKQVQIPTLK